MKFSALRPAAILLTAALGIVASQKASAQSSARQTTLPPTNPPDELSISAQVPMAYAEAGSAGSFVVRRTGSVLGDITIQYEVSGKAVAGQDYVALRGTRTIAASKDHVTITVNPLRVAGGGGTIKGVRVTLLPGGGYSLGSEVKATVKIVQ